jgi:ribosome-interacting GTPase 1
VVNVIAEAGDGALNQVESVVTLLGEKDLHLASRPRNELAEFGANQRPGMIVLTKADLVSEAMEHAETLRDLYEGRFEVVAVSARSGQGLDAWFEHIWQLLASIRVYAKQPGRPPDLSKPFTMPVGSTIEDLARHIHRDLPQTMKFARIWGAGRFDGQHVHRAEPLRDRDVVEIHE